MAISGYGFPCLPSSPCQLWGAGSDCLSSGALALALGWVAGSGFLGSSGAGSLALLGRSQGWRFLSAEIGIFSQISSVVLAGGRVLIKLGFPSRHPPFRKKLNFHERCQYLLFSSFLGIVCQFY